MQNLASSERPKWAATPKQFATLEGHTASVNALAFKFDSGSGKSTLYSGSGDETIRVWDLQTRACIHNLKEGHTGYISSMIVFKDFLISASYDQSICLWNTARMSLVKKINAHAHCVNALFEHESGVILSASWDKCVRVWDLRSNSTCQNGFAAIVKVPEPPLCIAAKGSDLFCGLHDSSIVALDLRTAKHRDTFTGHSRYVTSLALANLELFSASHDGSIRVTDIRDGRSRSVIETEHSCFSLYHRVDGSQRWLMSGHSDGIIRLTNVISGQTVQEYSTNSSEQIFAMVADTDGLLVAGGGSGTVRSWGKLPEKAGVVETDHLARVAKRKAAAIKLQKSWRGHFGRGIASRQRTVSPPEFSPEGGKLDPKSQVEITCRTVGASIHFTLDGSLPTGQSPQYKEPLNLFRGDDVENTSVEIKAIAVHTKAGMGASKVIESGAYTVTTVPQGKESEPPEAAQAAQSKTPTKKTQGTPKRTAEAQRVGGGFVPKPGEVSDALLRATTRRNSLKTTKTPKPTAKAETKAEKSNKK